MQQTLEKWLYDPTVNKIVVALVGILVVVIITRFIKMSLMKYIKDTDTRYKARKFTSFIGYVLAIIMLSIVFSDKLGGLNVALGVAGAGIAFALQEVIISIAGWFAISLSNFYKTGDRVQLGGIKGDVVDIGILRSTLMEVGDWVKGDLYNGRVVRVANSFVFREPVFNYSGDFPFLWDELTFPIKYGSDHNFARKVIQEVTERIVGEYAETAQQSWNELVKKYLIENARVKPLITMTADENHMLFTIRYVVDYKSRRITKDHLFSELLDAFAQNSDKIIIACSTMEISYAKDTEKKTK